MTSVTASMKLSLDKERDGLLHEERKHHAVGHKKVANKPIRFALSAFSFLFLCIALFRSLATEHPVYVWSILRIKKTEFPRVFSTD